MEDKYIEFLDNYEKSSAIMIMRKFRLTFQAANKIYLDYIRQKNEKKRILAKEVGNLL